jgi:transcriptional regulator with XRE-family HTH domain
MLRIDSTRNTDRYLRRRSLWRTEDGFAQETLTHIAGVERSHMGKIERGEHMPTLVVILKIAKALGRSSGELMLETEARLPASWYQSIEG